MNDEQTTVEVPQAMEVIYLFNIILIYYLLFSVLLINMLYISIVYLARYQLALACKFYKIIIIYNLLIAIIK